MPAPTYPLGATGNDEALSALSLLSSHREMGKVRGEIPSHYTYSFRH